MKGKFWVLRGFKRDTTEAFECEQIHEYYGLGIQQIFIYVSIISYVIK